MKKVLIIFGPTATGKTDLAIRLAKKFNGELISADSRQVYKNLDIGTGKVQPSSKVKKHNGFWIVDGVKIHGFDLVEPLGYETVSRDATPGHETVSRQGIFSAADFVKFANNTLIRISAANMLPIIVGGTGFYIKALLDGLASVGIPQDRKLRSQLEKLSTSTLFQKLAKINPSRAKSMNESDRANPRRLIRAIEVTTYKQKQSNRLTTYPPNHLPNYLFITLTAPNDLLYERADRWLATRIENGLIDEAKNLIDNKIQTSWLDNLGLEYRWITRYLKGEVSKDIAIERLKGDIHDFIRRQKTFQKQFKNAMIFNISHQNFQVEIEKLVSNWYNQKNGRF